MAFGTILEAVIFLVNTSPKQVIIRIDFQNARRSPLHLCPNYRFVFSAAGENWLVRIGFFSTIRRDLILRLLRLYFLRMAKTVVKHEYSACNTTFSSMAVIISIGIWRLHAYLKTPIGVPL